MHTHTHTNTHKHTRFFVLFIHMPPVAHTSMSLGCTRRVWVGIDVPLCRTPAQAPAESAMADTVFRHHPTPWERVVLVLGLAYAPFKVPQVR